MAANRRLLPPPPLPVAHFLFMYALRHSSFEFVPHCSHGTKTRRMRWGEEGAREGGRERWMESGKKRRAAKRGWMESGKKRRSGQNLLAPALLVSFLSSLSLSRSLALSLAPALILSLCLCLFPGSTASGDRRSTQRGCYQATTLRTYFWQRACGAPGQKTRRLSWRFRCS